MFRVESNAARPWWIENCDEEDGSSIERLRSWLSAHTINRLAQISKVVAVKFEPGGNELRAFNDPVRSVDDRVAWIANPHHERQLASKFHKKGADAFMDAIPNFAPDLDLEMYRNLARNDYLKAKQIQTRLAGVATLITRIGPLAVVKEAMNMVQGKECTEDVD